jgi:hypothetical protein
LEKFFTCLLALVWRLVFLKGVPPWFLTGTNHRLRGGVKFGVRKRDKWGGSQGKRDEPRKEAGLSLGRTGKGIASLFKDLYNPPPVDL